MTSPLEQEHVRCPTCAATQPPAAECRRCKCDLSLYVAVLEQRRQWRERRLQGLRDRHYDRALEAAQHYATLSPDHNVVRWIAVAHMLSGNFAAALATGAGAPTDGAE